MARTRAAERCRRKFLHYFPDGYRDETYVEWERSYKWRAHERWCERLDPRQFKALLRAGQHADVAAHAVATESRTNLLFSFEKMALRDALKTRDGASAFAQGLYDFLHGSGDERQRFERWCATVGALPRRQTRVLTWPLLTVFGFIATPDRHCFLKPRVTQRAAEAYGFEFDYRSRPNWETYASLLAFAEQVRKDTRDLKPRDMMDLQGFIWVMGSDEYPD